MTKTYLDFKGDAMINTVQFDTPLGNMVAFATTEGVCLLQFCDHKKLAIQSKDLSKKLNKKISPGNNANLDQLQAELLDYFTGKRKDFTVQLYSSGTEFQQSVWNALQAIPYGQTCSYKQQASKLVNPKAVRAVANANGQNRLCFIVPCHRVIGSNGELTGYSAGIERKKWLLEFEKSNC